MKYLIKTGAQITLLLDREVIIEVDREDDARSVLAAHMREFGRVVSGRINMQPLPEKKSEVPE